MSHDYITRTSALLTHSSIGKAFVGWTWEAGGFAVSTKRGWTLTKRQAETAIDDALTEIRPLAESKLMHQRLMEVEVRAHNRRFAEELGIPRLQGDGITYPGDD